MGVNASYSGTRCSGGRRCTVLFVVLKQFYHSSSCVYSYGFSICPGIGSGSS